MSLIARPPRVTCVVAIGMIGALAGLGQTQGPPRLDSAYHYIRLGSDGVVDDAIEIAFTETTSTRNQMRAIGPFLPPGKILRAGVMFPDGEARVCQFALNPAAPSPETYRFTWGESTKVGQTYKAIIRWVAGEPSVERTEVEGKKYTVFSWAPFQFDIAMGKETVHIALPVELDKSFNKPELVTDEVVNSVGLKTEATSDWPRIVYFPTPDEKTGKNWLSVSYEKTNLPPKGGGEIKFYLPEEYFTLAVAGAYGTDQHATARQGRPVYRGPNYWPATAVLAVCAVVAMAWWLYRRRRRPQAPFAPDARTADIRRTSAQTPRAWPQLVPRVGPDDLIDEWTKPDTGRP